MENYNIIIDKDKCVGCGLCAKVCAAHNITVKDKKAKTLIENCIKCGHCTAVCPKNAININGFEEIKIEKTAETLLNPNDVLNVIRFRRSVRHFKNQDVSDDILKQILEAGRLTHTAKNMQDVSFSVLKNEKDRIEKIAVSLVKKIKPMADIFSPLSRINKINDNFFFFNAPVAIVIFAKDKTNGILASQNMEFVAEANGLGVLYSGFFTMASNFSRKIKKAIMKPKGKKVAMTLVMGYPDTKFLRSPQRKELEVNYL